MEPFKKDTNISTNIVTDESSEKKDDFDLARDALRDLIIKNSSSIDEIRSISSNSESSRHYRVLGELTKTQSEVAKELMDLHLTKKKVEEESKQTLKQTNNNVFVGSTSELMKMLDKSDSKKTIDG